MSYTTAEREALRAALVILEQRADADLEDTVLRPNVELRAVGELRAVLELPDELSLETYTFREQRDRLRRQLEELAQSSFAQEVKLRRQLIDGRSERAVLRDKLAALSLELAKWNEQRPAAARLWSWLRQLRPRGFPYGRAGW